MRTKFAKTVLISLLLTIGIVLGNTSSVLSLGFKKETRNVKNFSEISLSIPADLYLTQGTKEEVIIEADDDVLEKIETEVDGETLEIKFEKWYNYRGHNKITVYVTMKEVEGLTVSGSGDIVAKSDIKAEKLNFMVSGSGSISVNYLLASEVYAMITGSGDINLAGKSKAKELDATITGSGDFESENLEFAEADLTITGSGSIRVYVSGEIDATITGSGKIYYKGKPVIDANITGSGKIQNSN